jgi:hypothetical protein
MLCLKRFQSENKRFQSENKRFQKRDKVLHVINDTGRGKDC